MSLVHYTRDAEQDLADIAAYTMDQWGAEQCGKYLDLLERTCEVILPKNLKHARPVPQRPELWRWRCERHVSYFRKVKSGIEIIRVLHERILPESHL